MVYQNTNFKICLSLFGCEVNILPKQHIVQWYTCRPDSLVAGSLVVGSLVVGSLVVGNLVGSVAVGFLVVGSPVGGSPVVVGSVGILIHSV